MIEYLNVIATVVLLFHAVFLLRKERFNLQRITNGIKSLNEVLDFLGSLPRWIEFYNNLIVNVHHLRERSQRLEDRQNDLNHRVEEEEFQTSRRRKKEVDHWLTSAETRCTEVQTLLQGMERDTSRLWKFVYRAWLGNLVERKIKEVDELYNSGVFEEVLSHVRERVELVTTTLVGDTAKENIRRIRTLLGNQVTKIGVYGIKGIGKTALMMHIHNQLLTRNHYAHVIMITVNEDQKEYDLQGEIARQLGISLEEEDGLKRAAMLHRALSRRNFVLILDGLKKYVSEDRIGIPLGVGTGKMIVTSRSLDVCRKTGCHNNLIAMDPLPNNEAFELFKQKVGVELQSPLENVAKKIIEQCKCVPLKIVNKAADLRGLDDISTWEETLNEMLAN